jgi:hypothetical protein
MSQFAPRFARHLEREGWAATESPDPTEEITLNILHPLILTALIAAQLAPAQTTTSDQPRYAFDIPAGWVRNDQDWGTILLSPKYPNGEVCQISMLAMRPAVGDSTDDLANDAIATYRNGFQADPLTTYPTPPPRLEYGISTQGWDYFVIRKLLGGQSGDPGAFGTIFMEARVGKWFATVVAISKDPLVSSCLGEIDGNAWPAFLSGLHFDNVKLNAVSDSDLKEWLAGTWTSTAGDIGLGYIFTSNGRYDDLATYVGPITNSAYFGKGSYAFDGNRIVLTRDGGNRSVYFFRFGQNSTNVGKSWQDQICLMDPTAADEVCYQRQ